jgi:hypothetical protein
MKTIDIICTIGFTVKDSTDAQIAMIDVCDRINHVLKHSELSERPKIDTNATMIITAIIPVRDIWKTIRTDYKENGYIHVDAWESDDKDADGRVIAKINSTTGAVRYMDTRASIDEKAQEAIADAIIALAKKK